MAPTPPSEEAARARVYHRRQLVLFLLGLALSIAYLLALIETRAAARLADFLARWTAAWWLELAIAMGIVALATYCLIQTHRVNVRLDRLKQDIFTLNFVRDAITKAGPVLLEPMMRIEVVTPEEYMGSILGDLQSRRGKIEDIESVGNSKFIQGLVPLAEMFGYTTVLRSSSQGRATYSMEFSHYEKMAKELSDRVVGVYRYHG